MVIQKERVHSQVVCLGLILREVFWAVVFKGFLKRFIGFLFFLGLLGLVWVLVILGFYYFCGGVFGWFVGFWKGG